MLRRHAFDDYEDGLFTCSVAPVRLLSTGHGRKSDAADAVSVGVAALTAQGLSTARMDAAVTVLRAIAPHRAGLVKTRTLMVNR
ncbi:hypothetical protein [Rhodococcus sp. (in: high G+C Gram-positive bacteria)]|uniref:hypothetical protein n=1 Tax=Rhodococcus sp. TaxID=1831 RepID=UPI00257F84DC|nr:hypothetical protein [Rhodococcus sp. (in: high G+C Gram-positive bacteria)]MBQ7805738.1 hypothetical protein [Rhodococcus sp. (in: high G+C Gram-positive bacteria)]